MIDIKQFVNNVEGLENHLRNRGYEDLSIAKLAVNNYTNYLENLKQLEELKATKNKEQKEIGIKIRQGMSPEEAKKGIDQINDQIIEVEKQTQKFYDDYYNTVIYFPNINSSDVPYGEGEEDNIEVANYFDNYKKTFDFEPKPHYEMTNLIDSQRAVKLSGSRFTLYKGEVAKLERAIVNFMLDLHQESGFEEVVVPTMVKTDILVNTGHLPKFAEGLYKIENEDKWLIPTAEVPLTNLYAGEIIDKDALPIRLSALSNSYRSESDSGGKDVKGVIRLHEFRKVEMVSIANPQNSVEEHEFMTNQAEEILRRLEIPYRKLLLCTQEVSGAGAKTYDLEVFMPGLDTWKEISSISLCTDYQSRNAQIRYKDGNEKVLVHTLNGSGLAVDRTLAAVLENYQNEDGTFEVPNALKKYYV